MTNRLTRSLWAILVLAAAIPAAGQPPETAAAPRPAVPRAATPAQMPPPAVAAPTPRPATGRLHPDSDNDKSAPQAFSVVLVLGDVQTATAADNVPAAARKALADMKDFLPYKSYRLLDTQWTLCCGREPSSSRLKGADDQEYQLQLSTSMVGDGRVNVRFYLAEPMQALTRTTGQSSDASAEERARIAEIEQQIARLRAQLNANAARPTPNREEQARLTSQIEALQKQVVESRGGFGSWKLAPRQSMRSSPLIDTSFRMDVGETVVVGTSRTRGDKALIALLTAVPPKTTVR
jgi:hypothetical protein